jgi:hypothetical protein
VDWQLERVVESADGRYEVVEKIERAAEVAAQLNPRKADAASGGGKL